MTFWNRDLLNLWSKGRLCRLGLRPLAACPIANLSTTVTSWPCVSNASAAPTPAISTQDKVYNEAYLLFRNHGDFDFGVDDKRTHHGRAHRIRLWKGFRIDLVEIGKIRRVGQIAGTGHHI